MDLPRTLDLIAGICFFADRCTNFHVSSDKFKWDSIQISKNHSLKVLFVILICFCCCHCLLILAKGQKTQEIQYFQINPQKVCEFHYGSWQKNLCGFSLLFSHPVSLFYTITSYLPYGLQSKMVPFTMLQSSSPFSWRPLAHSRANFCNS